MARSVLETSTFFSRMEEFGFFDTVEEHLPDEFTIIYEIARIIEDATHAISRSLAPIMELNDPSAVDASTEHILVPHVPEAKEYEADLIAAVSEVRYIYPAQFLLPETVFLRKLAERSLWMPRAKQPRNFRYQSESNRFAPDDRKQKVYILFDTSNSMQHHYRIHLAKAIVYMFLRQNQRELGTIFFRTFDLQVGELMTARDIPSYDHLISTVMHVKAVGNGTSLQKALQTAIDDISHESQLSHAQILVVTDGVAHIDLDHLRGQLGGQITVNTVKIGSARLQVDAVVVEGMVASSNAPEAVRIRELFKQRRDLESQLSATTGKMRLDSLRAQIGHVQNQISQQTSKYGAVLAEHYGDEIRKLSTVYVSVDDIAPDEMFSLPEEKVAEFEELAESLLESLRSERQVEDIKRAAILYDHLVLLMRYNKIDAQRFKDAAQELEQMLDHILNKPSSSSDDMPISELERAQLRNMLDSGSIGKRMSLALLLRIFWLKLVRAWRTRRQMRAFRALRGRNLAPRRKV
ncbi:MAG: VWA domain-containing protein [Candidatus Kapabacteria bacterium]|nr:VWA domain-containing protein [Candidatus Kapabacteria bacterium]